MPNVANPFTRDLLHRVTILSAAMVPTLWAAQASAQLTPIPGTGYSMDRTTETYTGCPGNLTNLSTGDGGGVQGPFDVNLPFTFRHYDTDYNSVTVIAAGALSFPAGQIGQNGWPTSVTNSFYFNNSAPGDPAEPNALIAAYWDDIELLTSNAGYLATSLTGTAPNREFCIEWFNFNEEQINASRMAMKIVLREGAAGAFDIHYGPTSGSAGNYDASMGLEDSTGGRAFDLLGANACSPMCDQAQLTALTNTKFSLTRDAGPELVPVSLTPPEFVFVGAASQIPVTVGNLHRNPIGPFDIGVYVADNPQMTNATLGGSRRVSVGGYENLEVNVETIAPASLPSGQAYFELRVDINDEIMEASETNNSLVSGSAPGRSVMAPDLSAVSFRSSTTAVDTGTAFDTYLTIRNVGSQAVSGGEAAVMLSTNPSITRFDTELSRFNLNLEPRETYSATVAVTMPAGLASGTYYIGLLADPDAAIDELDEVNNGLAYFAPITVSGAGLAVATTDLPTGTVLQQYFAILSASGGTPPFSWAVVSGTLPAGIGLVADTGQLYGVPEAEESQTFTVEVTDGAGGTAQGSLTLGIVEPETPLTVVTRDVPPAVVGQEYNFQLLATGDLGENPTLEWSAAGLPEGMTVVGDYLSGTPTTVGSSMVTLTVTFDGSTASRDVTLEVLANEQLLIVPTPLSTARVEQPYMAALEATGGTEPYTWLLDNGNLPEGLFISPNGTISGTPVETGIFSFSVRVLDGGLNGAAEDRASMTLEVVDDATLQITAEALQEATVGVPYAGSITAAGGRPPYDWTIEGELPDGLVGQPNDIELEYTIIGQVTEPATVQLLVNVEDASGRTAQRAYLFRAVPAPVIEEPEDTGCTCVERGEAPTFGLGLAFVGLVLFARRRRR